uniref:TIL domain-containing protein n=1 Tax=Meloidogyne incognita TaxID=6306 RepID=A0A914NTT2_MELIC
MNYPLQREVEPIITQSRWRLDPCVEFGEEFKKCASACEPKCSDLKNTSCDKSCQRAACQCKNGYARDDKNVCIPIEDCPKYKGN